MAGDEDQLAACSGEQLTDGTLRFQKRGRMMWEKWADGRCTLKDGRFLVYAADGGGCGRPLHDVPLCGIRLTVDHNNDGDNRCFKLKFTEHGVRTRFHMDEPGTLHFQASTHAELQKWVRALSRVPGVYRRPADFYDLGKLLGTGQTCRAYECTDKFSGEKYVMKRARESNSVEANRRIQNELEILQTSTHCSSRPSAIPLLHDHFFDAAGKTTILMELFRGGDLEVAMARKEAFTEREAQNVFRQIVEGVEFLHSHGVAHRDLKPDNIMVRNRHGPLDVAIGDYDLARLDFSPTWEGRTPCGTVSYMAPEIIHKRARYTQAVDMWSLGCVLTFILTGDHAINENQTDAQIEADVKARKFAMSQEEWERTIPASARDLCAKLLCDTAEDRLTAAQCLQHPWLRESRASDSPLPSVKNFRRRFSTQDLHRINSLVEMDNSQGARDLIHSAKRGLGLPDGPFRPPGAEGDEAGKEDGGSGEAAEGRRSTSRRDEQIEGLKVLLKESHITDVTEDDLLGRSLKVDESIP